MLNFGGKTVKEKVGIIKEQIRIKSFFIMDEETKTPEEETETSSDEEKTTEETDDDTDTEDAESEDEE